MADFREHRKGAVEVVVGKKKVGAPAFERRKNQRGSEEIIPQQTDKAGLLIDSLTRFWRNHVGSINHASSLWANLKTISSVSVNAT